MGKASSLSDLNRRQLIYPEGVLVLYRAERSEDLEGSCAIGHKDIQITSIGKILNIIKMLHLYSLSKSDRQAASVVLQFCMNKLRSYKIILFEDMPHTKQLLPPATAAIA